MHLGQSSVPNVPKQRAAVKCVDVLGYNPMMAPENTQCWGKYHCTVGFQFYCFGFISIATYNIRSSVCPYTPLKCKFSCLVEFKSNWKPAKHWTYPLTYLHIVIGVLYVNLWITKQMFWCAASFEHSATTCKRERKMKILSRWSQPLVWAFLICWRQTEVCSHFNHDRWLNFPRSLGVSSFCPPLSHPYTFTSKAWSFLFQKLPYANLYFCLQFGNVTLTTISLKNTSRCSLADWEIENLDDGWSGTRCQRLHACHRRRWGQLTNFLK